MSFSRIAWARDATRSRTDVSSLIRLSGIGMLHSGRWRNRSPRGQWPRGRRGFLLLARLFRRRGVRSAHLFLFNVAVTVLVVLRELLAHGCIDGSLFLRDS